MAIMVRRLRVSLLWARSYADPAASALGSWPRLQTALGAARAGGGLWALPWVGGAPQHFWERYLEVRSLDAAEQVDSKCAWRHLMPLRVAALARVERGQDGVRVAAEGLAYPHGAAAIVTLYLPGPLPLADAVDAARRARQTRRTVCWLRDSTRLTCTALELGARLLDRVAAVARGAFLGGPPRPPFSVATVVDVEQAPIDKAVPSGHAVHRALHGLCTWRRFWSKEAPAPLGPDTKLEPMRGESSTPADLLYAQRSARAVWFPGCASEHRDVDRRLHTLGCYHRNLALASLQTASLLSLAHWAYAFVHAGNATIPQASQGMVCLAARILGRLYGGRGCYATRSVRQQIEPSRAVVDAVREATRSGGPLH